MNKRRGKRGERGKTNRCTHTQDALAIYHVDGGRKRKRAIVVFKFVLQVLHHSKQAQEGLCLV